MKTLRIGRRAAAGFSLLEVLVTVTIFALLFAVLMGGWFQALKAQSRVSEAMSQVRRQQQLAVALRQLCGEILTPREGRGLRFAGDARGFQAESTASLLPGVGGAPVATTLQIEGQVPDLRLRVRHEGQADAVLARALQQAQLRYLDPQGRAHDTWPPTDIAPGGPGPEAALPAMLQLTLQFDGQSRPLTLLAAPRASAWNLQEPSSPFAIPLE